MNPPALASRASQFTQANDAYVAMSGYTRDELIGAQHHILHHPDMPGVAFKVLWDEVAAGRK